MYSDLDFIKDFSKIKISTICKANGIDKSNLWAGRVSAEKVKIVKKEIINEFEKIERKNNMNNLTKAQKDNLKKLKKEFENYEDYQNNRDFVEVNTTDLEALYNLRGYYIKGTDIFININKRPIKGGKFEFTAVGYDFIRWIESNKDNF